MALGITGGQELASGDAHFASTSWSRTAGVLSAIVLPSLRDLQGRARRFVLSACATGLILGLALMMSGVANSFSIEASRTVRAVGAKTWLVRSGSPGPFTAPAPFPLNDVSALRQRPGFSSAAPLLVGVAVATLPSTQERAATPASRDVNVLGVLPGRLGSPVVAAGRALSHAGEAVVDDATHARVGDRISLNGALFRVVGVVRGVSYFAGQPVVFVDIHDLDAMEHATVASAVLLDTRSPAPVHGFTALDTAAVEADLHRPIAQADQTITLIEALLWLVAAAIIAAVVYLSALERQVEFAVLKSFGTPNTYLFAGLVFEAVVMALASAAIGYGAELALAPTAALAVHVSLGDYLAVPALALVVGVIASFLPARRAARVDPALAFGSVK